MNARKQRWLLGLGAGHLVLVALGSASVSFEDLGIAGRLLGGYGALSGADSGYGFFAPGVDGQLVARFDIVDGEGRSEEVKLTTGSSHEADLRVGNIIDQFWSADDDNPGLASALAASLAGKLFGRHPEAREVAVRLDYFEPVSMEAFRDGSRPRMSHLYTARFVRKSGTEP